MNKKLIKKIEVGLVITLMLLVTAASLTTYANQNGLIEYSKVWEKKYTDGLEEKYERGYSLDIVYVDDDSMNGFIIAGDRNTTENNKKALYVLKTDTEGNEEWNKTYGSIGKHETAYCIQQTDDDGDGYQDDGFIIVGEYDNNLYLIKTNESGSTEPGEGWIKEFHTLGVSKGYCVQQTNDDDDVYQDDGFIIVGENYTNRYNHQDLWLVKTDENGDITWEQTYDGYNLNDYGFSVQQINSSLPNPEDRGYIVTGKLFENPDPQGQPYSDCCFLKYDSDGNLEYEWIYGFGYYGFEIGYSVKETLDGDYILTGQTSILGPIYAFLIKINQDNSVEWEQIYNTVNVGAVESVDVCQEGGYIMVGLGGNGGLAILKTDDEGVIELSTIHDETDWFYWPHTIQEIYPSEFTEEYIIGGLCKYPKGAMIPWDVDCFITNTIINGIPTQPLINGPTEGLVGVEYDFTFVSEDPEEDDVMYIIDWGDETTTETDYYTSGQQVVVSHIWNEPGEFEIKAKAMDIYNGDSEWSSWEFSIPIYDIEFHFSDHDDVIKWATNPDLMVDDDESSAATTCGFDSQLNNATNWTGFNQGTIYRVNVGVKAKTTFGIQNMKFKPYFNGQTLGEDYDFSATSTAKFYDFDITDDEHGPGYGYWNWSDIGDLDCYVNSSHIYHILMQLYCYHVRIVVSYYQ